MAYKVFARDIAAPFSHVIFYSEAQLDSKSTKLIGIPSKSLLQEVQNCQLKWCLDDKNTLTIARRVLRKLENPVFYQRVVKESCASLKALNKAVQKIRGQDFSRTTPQVLFRKLQNYLQKWIEVNIWGNIVNISDFHFNLLSDKVFRSIKARVQRSKMGVSPVEIFAILTTPTKRSLVVQQEIDLFRLLEYIQHHRRIRLLFQSKNDFKSQLRQSPLWPHLKRHTKKYDWLQYHYIGPTILSEQYFIDLLRGLVRQGIKARVKLREITTRERETARKQRALQSKLRFSGQELYWINMAKEFAYLKGLRKEIVFTASRSYDSLLREVANRFSLSLKQFQFMTPKEVFETLVGKKLPDINLLNRRIKYCVVYYPNRKAKVYIGRQAKQLATKIKEEKVVKRVRELKGTPAYPGKVQGRVVIISEAMDMKKMKKGAILVSPATNPNVMPAIVKARAIVTDEGGITCHAAIVSRELRIPCVIGTKIATQVLRDGDKVEVDAERGVIRKI